MLSTVATAVALDAALQETMFVLHVILLGVGGVIYISHTQAPLNFTLEESRP